MKIVAAEVILVEIPFHLRGTGVGIMPTAWNTLEFALVKLTDEMGNIGWGEGFGYSLIDATKAVIERLIFPTLVGQTVSDIPDWNRRTQRAQILKKMLGRAIEFGCLGLVHGCILQSRRSLARQHQGSMTGINAPCCGTF